MRSFSRLAAIAGLLCCLVPTPTWAVQVCDVGGQSVNPDNGNTTAGKTGLMRCRDGEGGPLLREEELRAGKFVGAVRSYRGGVLERDYSVDERGNRDGRYREYAATAGGPNTLLRDETYRSGTVVGLARTWRAAGTLQRITFQGDDGGQLAYAAFDTKGKLEDLGCASKPLLAPDADDATWCGHRGKPATTEFFAPDGTLRLRITFDRGERRKLETLWDNGKPHDVTETDAAGGSERSFSQTGVKRSEKVWVNQTIDGRNVRIDTLAQEFHESGTLVRETRAVAGTTGAELQLEKRWYLNGQPRDAVAYFRKDGQRMKRETRYFDNGRISFEGMWTLKGRYDTTPVGTHRSFDDDGRLRSERFHDDNGRVTRERELDANGGVLRDDQLFEDGSRKSMPAAKT